MRKLLAFSAALILGASSLCAQELIAYNPAGRWYVSVQGGPMYQSNENSFAYRYDNLGAKLITYSAAVSVGYNFDEIYGLRASVSYGLNRGACNREQTAMKGLYPYDFKNISAFLDLTIDINALTPLQAQAALAEMFRQNADLGGVIVKVSQGTGYTNPYAKAWLDLLTSNGKPAGTYHYLDLMGAKEEARHYAASVKPWLGKVALAIDYEGQTLSKGSGYLKDCLDEVYRLTGVKPMVYCSQSVTQSQNFSAIAAAGYPLWMAQYADYAAVHGFLKEPWHKGSVAPFSDYIMQQYTSQGYLQGWAKNLDLDLYKGTASDWAALCGDSAPTPTPTPTPTPEKLKGPTPTVIGEILDNKYGVGSAREKKLRAAGYDPAKCQAKVNELYNIASKIKPLVAGNMDYLVQIIKIVRQR